MILGIADTHASIWYVHNNPRLSKPAADFMEAVGASGDQIGISSISLVEIVYLIEKRRIDPTTLERIAVLLDRKGLLREVVVDLAVTKSLATIPRDQVPDMPDRVIAATALHLRVPLISRDRKIQASSVRTIW